MSKKIINDSSGGYMSVDRTEALKANWDRIQKLTLPGSSKPAEQFTAIIEIPEGSFYKYEVDKDTGCLTIDRPLPMPLPYNYGYFPQTLHGDGDPLDVCVLSRGPIHPLTKVKVVILGAFICVDNGEPDSKIVAKVDGEFLPESMFRSGKEHVRHYLETYKEGFIVKEFVGLEGALDIYAQDVLAYDEARK